MVFDLITLPLRIAASATKLGFEVTDRAVGALLHAAGRLIGVAEEPPGQAASAPAEGTNGMSWAVVVATPAPPGSASDTAPGIPDAETAPQPQDTIPDPQDAAPEPQDTIPHPQDAAPEPQDTIPHPQDTTPQPQDTAPQPPARAAAPEPGTGPLAAQAHVSAEPQFVEAFAEPGAEEGAGASVRVQEPWKGYGKMTASEIIARLDGATREELADVALYEGLHRRRRTVVTRARQQLQQATATAARHA